MSSFTGYVTYLKFVAGSQKGGVNQGDLINGVFALGDQRKLQNYTSSVVDFKGTVVAATAVNIPINWSPAVAGSFVIEGTISNTKVLITDVAPAAGSTAARELVVVTGAVSYSRTANTDTGVTQVVFYDVNGQVVTPPASTGTSGNAVGTIDTLGLVRANPMNNTAINGVNFQPPVGYADTTAQATGGKAVITADKLDATTSVTATYVYNNEFVPQNDIPLINMELQGIPLVAKARRIAIYYSQIAAFQAKTDYDMDMQGQLAEKAVGELSYEIDSEIVNFLYEMGTRNPLVWNGNNVVFNRTQPVGVSLAEHYESFRQVLDLASAQIYNATGGRFGANYIVVGADVIGILHFLKGFTAAPAKTMNGPYFAGTLDGFKVFVSPQLRYNGTSTPCFVGFNGETLETSAAVYAPYMPIVPTAQLQGPDGGTSQGFSTLYDLKELNPQLVCGFAVAGDPFAAFGTAAGNPFYTTSVSI